MKKILLFSVLSFFCFNMIISYSMPISGPKKDRIVYQYIYKNGKIVKSSKKEDNYQKFDANGNLTENKSILDDGKVYHQLYRYNYNNQKQIIHKSVETNGKLEGNSYAYDDMGNIIIENTFDENGNLKWSSKYSYIYNNGFLIEKMTYIKYSSSEEYVLQYHEKYIYNEKGLLVEIRKLPDDYLYKSKKYYENGNIMEETTYNMKGDIQENTKFNSKGKRIEYINNYIDELSVIFGTPTLIKSTFSYDKNENVDNIDYYSDGTKRVFKYSKSEEMKYIDFYDKNNQPIKRLEYVYVKKN